MNPCPSFALAAVLLAASIAPAPARADQGDPRLVELFESLRGADSAVSANEYERAITRIWLESERDDVDSLMVEAGEAMNGGDLVRAAALYDVVVSIAPRYAEGFSRRGAVAYLRGDSGSAVVDLDRALELEPRHFGAWLGRGLLRFEMDDPAGALAAFERVLELNPHSDIARAHAEELRKRMQ